MLEKERDHILAGALFVGGRLQLHCKGVKLFLLQNKKTWLILWIWSQQLQPIIRHNHRVKDVLVAQLTSISCNAHSTHLLSLSSFYRLLICFPYYMGKFWFSQVLVGTLVNSFGTVSLITVTMDNVVLKSVH